MSGTVFTGLALAHTHDGARLYAADAASTNVLVYNGKWQLDGILKDRRLPKGLTTYNVAAIGEKIYVSYAPPPGVESEVNGVIDVHDVATGQRLCTQVGHKGAIKTLAFNPNGQKMDSSGVDQTLRRWTVRTLTWNSSATCACVHPW